MSYSGQRQDRAERSHLEANAIMAAERAEREAKTAKLREMRLAKQQELATAAATTKPSEKPTVVMKKAQLAKRRKA